MTAANNRKVVLLSGGVESVTLLHKLKEDEAQFQSDGINLVPLFIDYAQRGADMERQACKTACSTLGLDLVEMDASGVGATFRNRQKARLHVPIPHRNLFILSLATSLASQEKAQSVVLALQQGDTTWYPSAQVGFIDSFGALLQNLEARITLETPLLHLSKTDIITLGKELRVDYTTTYSCMRGREKHCGTCKQCTDRRQSFIDAGFPEPDGFYEL